MVSPRLDLPSTAKKEDKELYTVATMAKGNPFSLDFLHEFNRLSK